MVSKLDFGGTLVHAFDDTTQSLKVSGIGAGGATTVNLQDGAGSAVNKGQTTAAGSLPVVLASDETVPVSTSNTTITVTPVISTSIYTSGDQLGAVNTLTNAVRANGTTSVNLSIVVKDIAAQSAAFDIIFFNASPTLVSTDNVAFNINSTNFLKAIGHVSIASGDYATFGSFSMATKTSVNLDLQATGATKDLYCVCVVRGTPTYAATTNLVLTFGLLQD